MPYLEWTPELDVGVGAMNTEHQKLIELMNHFADLAKKGVPRPEAAKALEALGQYTVEHFQHEEQVMEAMGFPELAKHQRIHRSLLEQFAEHAARFNRTGEHEELLMFLKVWLKSHIKGIDTKYGKHAKVSAA